MLELLDEALAAGARLVPCCELIGLSVRTVQRWRTQGADGGEDQRRGANSAPANKLSDKEVEQILELVKSKDFRDLPPSQIVPKLADLGIFAGSESTIYRILRRAKLNAHRGKAKPQTHKRPKGYTATGPNQIYSWDITYLHSPVRGQYFYLYLFLDIWSRKVVGWRVHDREDSELAAQAFAEICAAQSINPKQLVLHSDNGGPMKGATMKATLERLGVHQSLSRPRVSNDNPYSESAFRTLKYRPNYPQGPFESLEAARQWVEGFVSWYNEEHQHSGISFVTPSQRHAGQQEAVLANRERVYAEARARNPKRWTKNTRNWKRNHEVHLNRKTGSNEMVVEATTA